MVMALKLNDCHNGKHLQHHDQSKCAKVDARQKLCLPVFLDDEGIAHSAYAAKGKTGNHHFYLAGV
jgi:hypothetical protein